MKKRLRNWLKYQLKYSHTTHVILSYIGAFAMRCLYYTCRCTQHLPEQAQAFLKGEKSGIFIFWHGRMIMMPFLKDKGEFMALISHHGDGTLITTTMARFGIGAVRGSKSQGASDAVRNLVEVAQRGVNVAITPDGPRGPFQIAAPGAIYLAMRTGLPIVPLAFSASRSWRLRSWDKFMIPKPFSRISFVAGDAYHVPADLEGHALSLAVADMNARLDKTTAEADKYCGVQPA